MTYDFVNNMPFLRVVFIIFVLFIPVLLMNMLISMMANTYIQILRISAKEWRKQVNESF